VHPTPSPGRIFPSWWNVRQKVAIATLCVLYEIWQKGWGRRRGRGELGTMGKGLEEEKGGGGGIRNYGKRVVGGEGGGGGEF
jgi:hypothetical protein